MMGFGHVVLEKVCTRKVSYMFQRITILALFITFLIPLPAYALPSLDAQPAPVAQAGDGPDADEIDELINVAEEKLDEEEYEWALEIFDELINLGIEDPEQEADAYTGRGAALFYMGFHEAAVEDFTRAIELNPNQARPFNGRGLSYSSLGEVENALADYNQGIEVDPSYIFTYRSRGQYYTSLGEYESALADFNRGIELDPEFAHIYNDRGNAHRSLGLLDEAIADYERVAALDPDYHLAPFNLGLLYAYDLGEYDQAIRLYNSALAIEPEYAPAYLHRGVAYYNLGDEQREMADYGRAIETDPGYTVPFHYRGLTQYELKNCQIAIADYTEALRRGSDNPAVWYARGSGYMDLGMYEEAIEDLSEAIDGNPGYVLALFDRGFAYSELGEYEAAIEDFSRILEIQPDDIDALNDRGLAYVDSGNFDEALADFTRVIELWPDDALGYINRGYTYDQMGEHELGLADAERAVGLAPDDPIALGNRAFGYGQAGEPEKAFADFERAIELEPYAAIPYLDRGNLYRDLGVLYEAVEDLEIYLALEPNGDEQDEIQASVAEMRDELGDDAPPPLDPADVPVRPVFELEPSGFSRYLSRDGHYALHVPDSWYMAWEEFGGRQYHRFYFGDSLAADGLDAFLYIGLVEEETEKSFDGLDIQLLDELTGGTEPVAIEETGGEGYIQIVGHFDLEESDLASTPVSMTATLIVYDDRWYEIVWGVSERGADYRPLLELMVESISLGEPGPFEGISPAGSDPMLPPGCSTSPWTDGPAHLLEMLSFIPDSSDTRRYLTYGDIDVAHRALHLPRLTRIEEMESLPFSVIELSVPGLALGAPNLVAEDQLSFYGFNVLSVDRWIEAGFAPNVTTVVEYDYGTEIIATALEEAGYTAQPMQTGGTLYAIREDGETDLDWPLRTGMMGELNRIALDEGRFVVGRATATVEESLAAAAGERPSLADDPAYRALARALADPLLSDAGPLASLVVMAGSEFDSPEDFLGDQATEVIAGELVEQIEGELPSFTLAGFATRQHLEETYLVLAVVFPEGTEIEPAVETLRQRILNYRSLVGEHPMSDIWTYVRAAPVLTLNADEDGLPTALIVLQTNRGSGAFSTVFTWRRILQLRDLAFLLTTE